MQHFLRIYKLLSKYLFVPWQFRPNLEPFNVVIRIFTDHFIWKKGITKSDLIVNMQKFRFLWSPGMIFSLR